MGKKLGKKARKFAKKNLQSVLKRRRKLKSMFKRKAASRRVGNEDAAEGYEKVKSELHARGNSDDGAILNDQLENLFVEDDDHLNEDVSDSDGYLSEDPECPYISESENEDDSRGQNKEIHLELAKQKRKLERLLEKDPKFAEFVESRRSDLDQTRSEEIYSDDEGNTSYLDGVAVRQSQISHDDKVLTGHTIDVWCWLVMEQPDGSGFANLLNGFHAASQYGINFDDNSSPRIPNRAVFSKILTFVLCEADGVFRRLLGVPDSCSKECILKLKSTPKWKTVRPLMKSYLRSSLFLLNQVTDSQILVFILSRLRASVIFFTLFPSLVGRLIKILVHLWATGEESLSSSSFFFIRDIASQLSSDCLDTCLTRTYNAFIAHCKFVEPTNLKHLKFLMDSVVEIYSLNIQKSYQKVLLSVQQLASILRQALKTKGKEELKKIHNWQYVNCLDLWVKFITCNFRDHDLQQLLFLIIQVIRGIAYLFPGPRYVPLRFKCVHMLNHLSLSSRVFIPVASLVFDCLEYRGNSNSDTMKRMQINFSSLVKVPKQFLKSRDFHEECVLSAVELLVAHFVQWSYHISFPEVATIPLILLKRFHEKTNVESLRRLVKRLIDQVEQNIAFIQKKREEVSFSPNDQASVECFLQLEKTGPPAPFTRYYSSILQNSWF
ncbi:protein REBELOTE [Elaeis guineensis]|uniref:Nucleolar complex protein 2 homolog isoform X1 n=1 Tax=Elaeis guineensis var. tenera TaxID=51953 RepID=A0A6I9QAY0_ELAGV|nr:nucleolar complex protein 2 homolog isoform X1 [Elaeis guineensis]